MVPATIEAARAAKGKLAELVSGRSDVQGIGITRCDEGFAVKVNLSAPEGAATLPRRVAGVPVVVEVVGSVRKRSG